MENYNILRDLVAFNTIKDNDNTKIINYIECYLRNLGFETEYKTKDLVMRIGENPKLGFLGHTDTVEYIDEFKTPFSLREKDGYLYGLGACDMKGGISAMLDAIARIDFSKLKNGMKLYFTYDEEIGFNGVDELVGNNISFPEYMIFGEPTNNEIFTGHKGLLEYTINFKGLKAHSSNPDKGVSANLNAARFLCELEDFYNTNIKVEKIPTYEVSFTTMNAGIINGGSARNSIPAFCEVDLDFRIAKKEHMQMIKDKINELAQKYGATVNLLDSAEPFADQIDFLKEAKTTNFMTEAARIKDSKRMILGVGPVTAHEVNENISIESYNKLIEQYMDLIYNICG